MSSFCRRLMLALRAGAFAVAVLATAAQAAEQIPLPAPAFAYPSRSAPIEPARAAAPGMLGVTVANQAGCVIVTSLYLGGPAERAGLQVGDQIVAIDGQAITSDAQLLGLLGIRQPNERLELLVRRGLWMNRVAVALGPCDAVSSLPRSPAVPRPMQYRRRGAIDGRRALNIYDPYLRAINTNFGS